MFRCECKGCDCCKGPRGECQRVGHGRDDDVAGIGPGRLYCVECGEQPHDPCPACGQPWDKTKIPPPRVPLDIRCACCCQ